MTDQTMPGHKWRNYLRRYRKKLRVFKAEDGNYEIKCKNGTIGVYSISQGLLNYAHMGTGQKLTWILKKAPELHIQTQGDDEAILIFKESDLKKYIKILQIRTKRQVVLTEKQKEALKIRLAKAREKLNNTHKKDYLAKELKITGPDVETLIKEPESQILMFKPHKNHPLNQKSQPRPDFTPQKDRKGQATSSYIVSSPRLNKTAPAPESIINGGDDKTWK